MSLVSPQRLRQSILASLFLLFFVFSIAGCGSSQNSCGDGLLDVGEACDDGNTGNGDGCDSLCRTEVPSGDQNDDPSPCGNGTLDPGEICDDGNNVDDDGCDSNCTLTACGNGIATNHEDCDDGNNIDGDGCDSNCTLTACGNGILTEGEVCDDGNTVNDDGCDTNCTPTGCGNGALGSDEECDDGNSVDGDGCDSDCTFTACGNGILTDGEECDDGNNIEGDGCDRNCTRTACGNGVVTAGEECDDGNNISLDGCDSSCVVEPFEIEPNEDGNVSTGGGTQGNDFGSAIPDANGAFTDSVTLLASLSPVGDEDVFKFSNPGTTPVAIYFDIWNRNPGSCDDFNTIDTVLHIREADGDLLASNDNRDELGFDHCSSLAVSLAPGKSVYAHVVEASDNKAYPYIGYALQATYAPIVCGDGIVTLNET
ncbi:MAG TPA: hypothetical protein DF383_03765, partial [Deltaproteobacteria bacterium]|nr:hypothetical protein [Deltaproteobacteria bacterium]